MHIRCGGYRHCSSVQRDRLIGIFLAISDSSQKCQVDWSVLAEKVVTIYKTKSGHKLTFCLPDMSTRTPTYSQSVDSFVMICPQSMSVASLYPCQRYTLLRPCLRDTVTCKPPWAPSQDGHVWMLGTDLSLPLQHNRTISSHREQRRARCLRRQTWPTGVKAAGVKVICLAGPPKMGRIPLRHTQGMSESAFFRLLWCAVAAQVVQNDHRM